ncbi:MAG: stage II sporulation protein M, partial [Candidatus Eremiobacterota bacterium]
DLARARSLGAPASTVEYLNRLAVAGHSLLYGFSRPRTRVHPGQWYYAFARGVRSAPGAVLTAFLALFVPAVVSYLAVQLYPILAFDLVGPEFYDFRPTSAEHLHEIPHLVRPIAASTIISNNLQVTFMAFALGITAGIGTTLLLIYNGIHIGSVAGWMTYQGQARSLWGWIMPHGATELIAICLAGAAGYLLADAILAPGLRTRVAALQQAGSRALVIELGCMAMLLFAGLIEGLVSPSAIPFGARLAILAASLLLWGVYFFFAGRGVAPGQAPTEPEEWWVEADSAG